jgi:hypothetical protein
MPRSRPRLSATARGYGKGRPRVLAKTAARGYGGPHVTTRSEYVAAYHRGQPCAIGGEPLTCDPRWLDLAHDHASGGYLGLACRRHNRGHHDKPRMVTTLRTSRPW